MNHLGLIMDGNRRWAKNNGKTVMVGHKQGYLSLKKLLDEVKYLKIRYVSVYAFSTENWSRSKQEVFGLLKLLKWVAKNETKFLIESEIKVTFLSSKENVPKDILEAMDYIESETARFKKWNLGICFNYGGKQEIVDAVSKINQAGEEVTIDNIEKNLYAPEFPPLDLIIRTSGEKRLSNFMLWRSDYSELYFSDKMWPDFKPNDLRIIVQDYVARDRRFGK